MADNTSEEIFGIVSKIIFYNNDNNYIVFKLETEDDDVICVGHSKKVNVGDRLKLSGYYVDNIKYGIQFNFFHLEFEILKTKDDIEKYLSSGAIKGIGPKLAKAIIYEFGDDTLDIIQNYPQKLSIVRGISQKKAYIISDYFNQQSLSKDIYLFLLNIGFTSKTADKIYEKYKENTIDIIKNNPYTLINDFNKISFETVDRIAEKVGIDKDSFQRIESAIIYILNKLQQFGDLYVDYDELLKNIKKLLDISAFNINLIFDNMIVDRKIKIKEIDNKKCVFLLANYNTEKNLSSLLLEKNKKYSINKEKIAEHIKNYEKKEKILLDKTQKDAVIEAYKNNIFILTGGPGTGKTTTIKAIIDVFNKEGLNVLLASPTGRAARRMSETCGYKACTIHKLLDVASIDDDSSSKVYFNINENNKLDCDVLIVDEASMIDIFLMYAMIKGLKESTRLILVGDIDQLPSVGPGQVLNDIISSNIFSFVKLSTIFRQAKESNIIANAHRINNGKDIVIDNNSDFFFISKNNEDEIIKTIKDLITKRLPKFTKINSFNIQVLSPMKKGILGASGLNNVLQDYLNPNSNNIKEIKTQNNIFRLNDRIIQIKNNYNLKWEIRSREGILLEDGMGVFNGDIGKIVEIDKYLEEVTIVFDNNREVIYSYEDLNDIDLSYAITIHKSQGSEYDIVILPILNGPNILMHRNLLYTAVTRAKKYVVIVGNMDSIRNMINNKIEKTRKTSLKYFLTHYNDF